MPAGSSCNTSRELQLVGLAHLSFKCQDVVTRVRTYNALQLWHTLQKYSWPRYFWRSPKKLECEQSIHRCSCSSSGGGSGDYTSLKSSGLPLSLLSTVFLKLLGLSNVGPVFGPVFLLVSAYSSCLWVLPVPWGQYCFSQVLVMNLIYRSYVLRLRLMKTHSTNIRH